jgi:hypothetical protein
MSPELALLEAAERWWVAQRPAGWDQAKHLQTPAARQDGWIYGILEHNEGTAEFALANAVASYIKMRSEDTRR